MLMIVAHASLLSAPEVLDIHNAAVAEPEPWKEWYNTWKHIARSTGLSYKKEPVLVLKLRSGSHPHNQRR